jgi:hypothetical protein
MENPEVVCITGGSIEVHRADLVPVHREPDGTVTYGEPLHVEANVRIFLHSEDGFFAFSLTPAQARALTASVDRHCPDADPADTEAAGAV